VSVPCTQRGADSGADSGHWGGGVCTLQRREEQTVVTRGGGGVCTLHTERSRQWSRQWALGEGEVSVPCTQRGADSGH
jgi:hypothetical protein